MIGRRKLCFALLVAGLSLCVTTGIADDEDKVTVLNADSAEPIGIMLDGMRGDVEVDDAAYPLPAGTSSQSVGNMQESDWDEVVVFEKGRMVGIQKGGWTESGGEECRITLEDEKPVDLVVWFVKDASSAAVNRAYYSAALAHVIWANERMGLRLGTVTLKREAAGAHKNLERINCTASDCKEGDDLKTAVGYERNMVNVYYVDQVNYGDGWATTNGVWCQDDVVILGRDARTDLLGHEFGHALSLNHVTGSDFTETNVMWALSVCRKYYTEGQVLRAHVLEGSAINDTYSLRPGATTHPCNDPKECPDVAFRIWNDG